ncbi:MAG TPA: amino acid dehydrogenase [Bacillota bacterium]
MSVGEGVLQKKRLTLFEQMNEHEQVMFCNDPSTGLESIIAIHNTTLGPALGGCRMYPYDSVDEALEDVLRLSEGMTYKCAAADVDFGGGKAVIIGDPLTDKTPELFRSFGQFVDSLGGRFYTGTDMGTTMDDFVYSLRETNYIVGVPEAYGGGGDSSIPTAKGILYGLQATNQVLFGTDDLASVTYAVQGLGKVGYKVTTRLVEAGAHVYVTDIHEERLAAIQHVGKTTKGSITVVEPEDIYAQGADIFVPCALGGVINDATIRQLNVKAVAGSANNQLLNEEHAKRLKEKGILFAPDYIINSGGLIQVADELYGANQERVMLKTKEIYNMLLNVYKHAENEDVTTVEAANIICKDILKQRARRNSFYSRTVRPKWNMRS